MRILPLVAIGFFVSNVYECGAESTQCRVLDSKNASKKFNAYGRLRSAETPTIPIIPCPSNMTTIIKPSNCSFCSLTEMVSCFGGVTYLPMPSELPKWVSRLDVSSSSIQVISGAAFYEKEIGEIHIQNNKLALISQKAFDGVKRLRYLNLANNRMPYIMVDMFAELKELATLVLDDNYLEVTSAGDFVSASGIFGSLSENDSKPNRINQMQSLQHLSLANNPLKQLSKQSLRWLKGSKLTELSLRGTRLESVHKGKMDLYYSSLYY